MITTIILNTYIIDGEQYVKYKDYKCIKNTVCKNIEEMKEKLKKYEENTNDKWIKTNVGWVNSLNGYEELTEKYNKLQ